MWDGGTPGCGSCGSRRASAVSEDARTRGRDDAGLTRDADAQDNRTAYVRAKARAEYEKHASAEGETLEEALRLAAAQVDNVEASAAHLTKVFSDERVHARV